ncbi:ROK family protein [Rhodococcus sp. BP-252]|uniref:ROK family protein n=1 Tax=unclassified Rhodococcus (in: high G+C Gram-positive bacteria) TaxID=192944 RepID=UPI001C9AD0B5|nr:MULTISPECIES: ROK family protein [unclassified Rhodococcus (in: high G+C Gram-positive bacteria)]MBY6472243.1 ROK family protein [Rhodococcus sp. BP-313]MBY6419789.1 ROK family protein [Rhodococcus sp. BP-321]MBY6424746.1 ROK family protein [Rhodococcus sp. BP-324]MBY6462582.1 ROK family protein [Rhodococcus sp. BP-260]MBY6477189.1 ROK family protein [Rhodococcus sp. BP-261]
MYRTPKTTRASASKALNLSTGAATSLIAFMRSAYLLDETPVAESRRGRPTTESSAHPNGPVALLLDLQHNGFHAAIANLEGALRPVSDHRNGSIDSSFAAARAAITAVAEQYGSRIRVVVVCDRERPSPAGEGQSVIDWVRSIDGLSSILSEDISAIFVGRTSLEAQAEAFTGAAAGSHRSLHLVVSDEATGALVTDGNVVGDVHGYGHLPFGSSSHRCSCGARGCWGSAIDGYALAALCGDPRPADPDLYVREVAASLDRNPPRANLQYAAFESAAAIFGKAVAALVNLCDPDVVTLGGVGPILRRTCPGAFTYAYTNGLMSARKQGIANRILDSVHGPHGGMIGAVDIALRHLRAPAALEAWSRRAETANTSTSEPN